MNFFFLFTRLQTTRLLRSTILSPNSTSPTSAVPQQQCLPQVWRSETIVQVFLDFWLEYTEEDQFSPNRSPQVSGNLPQRVGQFYQIFSSNLFYLCSSCKFCS